MHRSGHTSANIYTGLALSNKRVLIYVYSCALINFQNPVIIPATSHIKYVGIDCRFGVAINTNHIAPLVICGCDGVIVHIGFAM